MERDFATVPAPEPPNSQQIKEARVGIVKAGLPTSEARRADGTASGHKLVLVEHVPVWKALPLEEVFISSRLRQRPLERKRFLDESVG
ncbi:hypothetical protein NDU88_004170 [Pleurodeles waltl]|uniref:Uncharacterized protein n=1 Tax=Pleurodeles waltl TaxID=8319 RepID=A0AAV7T751_PLEWA|nr:hypothetical protein NDU88_004170 [Pleurodeles waltl]